MKMDNNNTASSEGRDEAAGSVKDADSKVPRHPAIVAALPSPSPQHHYLQPRL